MNSKELHGSPSFGLTKFRYFLRTFERLRDLTPQILSYTCSYISVDRHISLACGLLQGMNYEFRIIIQSEQMQMMAVAQFYKACHLYHCYYKSMLRIKFILGVWHYRHFYNYAY